MSAWTEEDERWSRDSKMRGLCMAILEGRVSTTVPQLAEYLQEFGFNNLAQMTIYCSEGEMWSTLQGWCRMMIGWNDEDGRRLYGGIVRAEKDASNDRSWKDIVLPGEGNEWLGHLGDIE